MGDSFYGGLILAERAARPMAAVIDRVFPVWLIKQIHSTAKRSVLPVDFRSNLRLTLFVVSLHMPDSPVNHQTNTTGQQAKDQTRKSPRQGASVPR